MCPCIFNARTKEPEDKVVVVTEEKRLVPGSKVCFSGEVCFPAERFTSEKCMPVELWSYSGLQMRFNVTELRQNLWYIEGTRAVQWAIIAAECSGNSTTGGKSLLSDF